MHGSGLCLNTYTVSFFGHRAIEDPLLIEQRLDALLRKLLKEKEYVEFLVGRDGEFYLQVSSVHQDINKDTVSIRGDDGCVILDKYIFDF